MYKIEKDIPIPIDDELVNFAMRIREYEELLDSLVIGDSVLLPKDTENLLLSPFLDRERSFVTKKEEDGIRYWRKK